MLVIKEPYLRQENGKCRLLCDTTVDGETRTIWFETDAAYGKYLCTERADGFLIGLLRWAMMHGHDIQCEAPVTEELYYQITANLSPILVKYGSRPTARGLYLHPIRITAPLAPALQAGTEVGTGFSCGVDSFTTILKHRDSPCKDMNLTLLCINNVGAFKDDALRKERYRIAETVAKELGLPLLATDSNFAEAFPQSHLCSHIYSSTFAVYMLQKLWRVFYYASEGWDWSQFSLVDNHHYDPGFYDLLAFPAFSIPGLTIYSDGGELWRWEKLDFLRGYDLPKKYLHVCVPKPYNCGVCSKCRRTLVMLDYLDALDDFAAVFDVEAYRRNRQDYYRWLYYMHAQTFQWRHSPWPKPAKNESWLDAVYDGLVQQGKLDPNGLW